MTPRDVIQRVVDGTTTMHEAKARIAADPSAHAELCELSVRMLRELTRLRHLPSYDLLDMIERYLDKSFKRQIDVLEREKEAQVCAQNFEAAYEINEQKKELEAFWSSEALLKRVRYALGKDS